MIVEFDDLDLRRLYEDESYRTKQLGPDLVKAFRKKVGLLRRVSDDQELRHFRSLRLEQLKGDVSGLSSIRLNDQWRLLLRFRSDDIGRVVVVVKIIDYHS